ncbi:hypothetical protein EJ04DRAFT_514116 [Polyplosphaeria fusca]|uniref:Peroxin 11C n=1 Tax=Polyplosphaeria fusca TaxID=682080 RepID=A0A9P4V0E4_9PLEO|nr:hypothetical protein EJ04DRAFT_514116 [Polyplosphaeria fusca]
MSDQVAEPGAPSAKAADKASDKVTAKDVQVPSNALSAAQQVDHVILRLNKLLANPGGLSSFLSTLNYTLYIAAYLQPRTPSTSTLARHLLALLKPSSPYAKPPPTTLIPNAAAVSPIAALAGMISRARTTLRLLGLFPLYTWLRTLLAGRKPTADPVLHRIALLQCLSYTTYQALENVCTLVDNGVASKNIIAFLNRGDPSTARVYTWAYRAWLTGVSCDFLRLAREAQIEGKRRATRSQMQEDGRALAEDQDESDAKFDAKWWSDLMICSAWFPMALHFASAKGLPGWNLGVMGICGLVAGSTRTQALWGATLHP